jgi:hypothetical protein
MDILGTAFSPTDQQDPTQRTRPNPIAQALQVISLRMPRLLGAVAPAASQILAPSMQIRGAAGVAQPAVANPFGPAPAMPAGGVMPGYRLAGMRPYGSRVPDPGFTTVRPGETPGQWPLPRPTTPTPPPAPPTGPTAAEAAAAQRAREKAAAAQQRAAQRGYPTGGYQRDRGY